MHRGSLCEEALGAVKRACWEEEREKGSCQAQLIQLSDMATTLAEAPDNTQEKSKLRSKSIFDGKMNHCFIISHDNLWYFKELDTR